jgi:hypothetical protein
MAFDSPIRPDLCNLSAVSPVMHSQTHPFSRLILGIVLVLATALPALRAQTVLVWSMGNSQTGTQAIATWLGASGSFTSVTAYDGTAKTLADLADFQEILFFSNSSFNSDPAVGNVLADFADTGRRLVLATFAYANQGGNTLGGRLITDSISPVVYNGTSLYTNATLGTTDGSALFNGVGSLSGYYRDTVSAVSGAVVRATWSDGRPLLVTKNNVIAITLFPDSNSTASGDYQRLFINALSVNAIPEPSTWALLLVGAATLGLTALRRRR